MSLIESSLEKIQSIATETYKKIDDNTKDNPLITLVVAVSSTIFALIIIPFSVLISFAILILSSPIYISLFKNSELVIEKIKDKILGSKVSEKPVPDDVVKKAENFFYRLWGKNLNVFRTFKD